MKELVDNSQAVSIAGGVLLPYEEVSALTADEQASLELPERYPFEILIKAQGLLTDSNLSYKLRFMKHKDGEQLEIDRNGAHLQTELGAYLLSSEEYQLCEAVQEFNGKEEKERTKSYNLRWFSDIKRLAHQADAHLDEYLRNEEAIAPKKIDIVLDRGDDDTLKVDPAISTFPDFTHRFRVFPNPKELYSVQTESGGRQRVAFDEQQVAALREFKKLETLEGDERDEFVEHPEVILDPDIVDLENFSERVCELGFYKPRYYPFVSPYRSQWIPGLIIEESPGERYKICLSTQDEVDEMNKMVVGAIREGRDSIEWDNKVIPVAEADKLVTIARKQLDSPDKPVKSADDGANSKPEEKVLIIYENVEELGFDKMTGLTKDVEHVFIPPPNLTSEASLLPHQEEGVAWLQGTFKLGLSGVLLADDMGLGKTLQVMSFIIWHHSQEIDSRRPYLVVAPVALLQNWETEFRKFFPTSEISIVSLHGASGRTFESKSIQESSLYLTTYETLRSRQKQLCAIDWATAVLDEAQKIKTPGTLVTNAAKALKTDFFIAMTGTPVENTLVDMWCIVDACAPGRLGSAREFSKRYQHPLRNEDTDVKALGEELRQEIGVYLKRRIKEDVLHDLPRKNEIRDELEMPELQRSRYDLAIKNLEEAKQSKDDARGAVLKTIFAMREISDHPLLPEWEIEKFDIDHLIDTSAKLSLTVGTLEKICNRDEKVILFSESRKVQQLLAQVLKNKFGLSDISIINGKTPAHVQGRRRSRKTRQAVIDVFEESVGFNALVASPLAAGVGLNITKANHVIHYTRHWNPAKESQATDRVHRIGQDKEVFVYYPKSICKDFKTFDVIIDELLQRKYGLASASLFPTERAEVKPGEIIEELTYSPPNEPATPYKDQPLSLSDAGKLKPQLFEALCACAWAKEGMSAKLTPYSNDKGADVVCFAPEGRPNLLLQVKQAQGTVGVKAVQEITAAKAYYEDKFNCEFELAVVTNGEFTSSAQQMAQMNKVTFYHKSELRNRLESRGITLSDVQKMEDRRI